MRFLAILTCMAVALTIASNARAQTTAQVIGTWPSGNPVTLGHNQTFYVHVRYHSDVPTQIWVQPYNADGRVKAGSNPSRVYPAGDGDALVWFFFMQPGERVTGIRIDAGDGTHAGTHSVADYPVEVYGGDQPSPKAAAPEWVTRLRARDKAAQDAAYKEAMNRPGTTGDMLLFNSFMLLMMAVGIFGLLGPAWGVWRWRGGWRIAAAIPAAVMAFVVLRLLIGVAVDPTSHNLWPFEILIAGGPCCVFMLGLFIAKKFTSTRRTA